MKTPVYPALDDVMAMDREALVKAFRAAQIGQIPKSASLNFLRGNLAWAVQAAADDRDPVQLRKALLAKAHKRPRRKLPIYKPGTRLIREWQGVTHEVTVEEQGYTWNGNRYRSLSHIARDITGTRWSGPRFFGLTGKTP